MPECCSHGSWELSPGPNRGILSDQLLSLPSGDDRRSTVTVVHERSDIIHDAPRKGTLRKLHYIVSDVCFDRITSHFPRFGNSTRVRGQTDKT